MRVGRLILGTAVLGAIGTFAYRRASDENKKKILGYVKRAVDWLPERLRGYIPHNILDKLENSSSSAGSESGSRSSSGSSVSGSQGRGNAGFQSAGSR
jgi:hypothetical protein